MQESNRRSITQRERDLKVLIEQYKAWIDNIRATGEALYQIYRDENVKTRGRSKTPICFKEKYKLPLEAKKIPRLPNVEVTKLKINSKPISSKLNKKLKIFQEKFRDLQNISPDQVLEHEYDAEEIFRG